MKRRLQYISMTLKYAPYSLRKWLAICLVIYTSFVGAIVALVTFALARKG